LFFTCTNNSQAATCTWNTEPRISPHNVVNHSSHQEATIHRGQSLITPGSDHPPVLEPHMVLNSPPKALSKGTRCWVFLVLGLEAFLVTSSIPLNLTSFGGPNLGYGMPMRCSYYPQSLAQICGAIWEIGSWIRGSCPAGVVHPDSSSHIGLTGAAHWSDRCRLLVEFCSGEHRSEFPVVSCWCYFEFCFVLSHKVRCVVLGLPGLHRSNRRATSA
jgi:hypothetical protein